MESFITYRYTELRKDPVRVFDYMTMKIETFGYILNEFRDKLNKNYQNCHRRLTFIYP